MKRFTAGSFSTRLNSQFLRFVVLASIVSALGWLWVSSSSSDSPKRLRLPHVPWFTAPQRAHPIDKLIQDAKVEWDRLVDRQTDDIETAAAAYRTRRGRHPPPGFDVWFNFAKQHDALVVEEFFDPIHSDLNPFWGVNASSIRQQAREYEHTVSIRNHNATWNSDRDRIWMRLWHDLIATIAEHLPDLDIAINVMDESRVIAPWEDITEYIKREQEGRRVVPIADVVTNYTGLADVDDDMARTEAEWTAWIKKGPYWEIARVGCPPDSESRNAPAVQDFSGPLPMRSGFPPKSYEGYVANWTWVKDPCVQPDLRGLHGTFIEPISTSTTHELVPMFGGSKLPMNNEILLPPAMYWSADERYSGGEDEHGPPWSEKKNQLVWRGAGTGGRNKENTWPRFQRHRFVSMLNGTSVSLAEKADEDAINFVLPSFADYHLMAPKNGIGMLGEWVSSFSDAGIYDLVCFPNPKHQWSCSYTEPYYELAKKMPMKDQYRYKFLPDIDGNSFSGRYRGFLRSTSLPIKATIYNEWHDSRLVPWQHFVPMDNTFIDIYGIMDYFLGYDGVGSHDKEAETIASNGKSWAMKVLRKEDMQIYVLRLLLEYARVCDDKRDLLGYVGDLLPKS